ncbi:hypothetical protein [uncultured Nostoc sp.]|uniref:hypothetical protein n=1 Tax=uncultured Nostoc sp. TaxID=340711 RepID=UPI0035CBDA9B
MSHDKPSGWVRQSLMGSHCGGRVKRHKGGSAPKRVSRLVPCASPLLPNGEGETRWLTAVYLRIGIIRGAIAFS